MQQPAKAVPAACKRNAVDSLLHRCASRSEYSFGPPLAPASRPWHPQVKTVSFVDVSAPLTRFHSTQKYERKFLSEKEVSPTFLLAHTREQSATSQLYARFMHSLRGKYGRKFLPEGEFPPTFALASGSEGRVRHRLFAQLTCIHYCSKIWSKLPVRRGICANNCFGLQQ